MSGYYRILRTIRGFDLWYSAPHQYGRLAQEISSMEHAKQFAERHAQREREKSDA